MFSSVPSKIKVSDPLAIAAKNNSCFRRKNELLGVIVDLGVSESNKGEGEFDEKQRG